MLIRHPAMSPARRILLLGVALPALITLPALADHDHGVTLYEHDDYGGRYETFTGDVADLGRTQIGNDRATSIYISRGCEAVLYRDTDFRGESLSLSGEEEIPNLGRTRVGNDSVSSLEVYCRRGGAWDGRPGAMLYADTGFGGAYERLEYDDADLGNNPIGNDRVSSIRVSPDCDVVVFEDTKFRGRAIKVEDDIEDLGRTYLGNDRMSSIQVRCRGAGYDRGRDRDQRRDRDTRIDRSRDRDHDNDHSGGGGVFDRDPGDRDPGYGAPGRSEGTVVVFADVGFRGRSGTFRGDMPSLRQAGLDDAISSLRVPRGCDVILFEDEGYRGRAAVFSRDTDSLSGSRVGNDRASSLQIRCWSRR